MSLLVWEHDPIPHGLSAHVVGVSQFIPRNLAKKIIAINIKKNVLIKKRRMKNACKAGAALLKIWGSNNYKMH